MYCSVVRHKAFSLGSAYHTVRRKEPTGAVGGRKTRNWDVPFRVLCHSLRPRAMRSVDSAGEVAVLLD